MKKVKTTITLVRDSKRFSKSNEDWHLDIDNPGAIIEDCIQQWVHDETCTEVMLEMTISSPFQFKSTSQMGYFHAAVLPPFYRFMKEQGHDGNEKQMKDELKYHPEINWIETRKDIFDGHLYQCPKSYSLASKEEMSDIIDKHIRVGADFGIEIETPEDYKKRKGINDFT